MSVSEKTSFTDKKVADLVWTSAKRRSKHNLTLAVTPAQSTTSWTPDLK
jgi:Ca2+-dependent lipid-binding protein